MASDVADFYANRSVLITGFTGFLGKVLVEKLLRSVPLIKEIYVLIRPMKGVDATERLEKVLNSDLFDLLREINGDNKEIFSKVIAINGDITEPGLGLSVDDAKTICDRVSVVFHCAATVKFDEHMRLAVKMNVEGTKQLLDLCHKMKRLDAFVHTSTAYCNCNRSYIVERVYPSPVPWEKLMDSVQWMDDGMLDRLTPLLIGSRPNSYTFTKAVAESLLIDDREAHSRLPIVIVRPSIVTATWKEPKPGWVDNFNGTTGVLSLAAKGLVNTVYGRIHEVRADLIPVDVVVNMLIVAGWHKGVGVGRPMPVIHCTSGRLNPVTWGDVTDTVVRSFSRNMPLLDVYRLPGGITTTWRFEYEMRLYLLHLLPAYVVDWISILFGRRGRMVNVYKKIFRLLETMEYFYTNQWDFQSKMAVLLNKQLSEVDRKLFYIDITDLDWQKYFVDYHWGIRKHIFKEDPSNLAKAKWVHLRRRVAMGAIDMTLVAFVLRLLIGKQKFWKLFYGMLSLMSKFISTFRKMT